MSEVFVGIAVSQSELGVAVIPTGDLETMPNDTSSIEQLVQTVQSLDPTLVIIESGDASDALVCGSLAAGGLPFVSIADRQIRDFAKALGKSGDEVDAALIARFGQAARPEPKRLAADMTQELEALMNRRRQLSDMLDAEHARSAAARPRIRTDIEQHVEWLRQRLHDLDRGLSTIVGGGEPAEPPAPPSFDTSTGTGTNPALTAHDSPVEGSSPDSEAPKKRRKLSRLGAALARTKSESSATAENLARALQAKKNQAPSSPAPAAAESTRATTEPGGTGAPISLKCAACGTSQRVARSPDGKLRLRGWKAIREGESLMHFCARCANPGSPFQ